MEHRARQTEQLRHANTKGSTQTSIHALGFNPSPHAKHDLATFPRRTPPPAAGHRALWRQRSEVRPYSDIWGQTGAVLFGFFFTGAGGGGPNGGLGRKGIVGGLPVAIRHLLRGRARRTSSTDIRTAGSAVEAKAATSQRGWGCYGGYVRGDGATTTRRRCPPGGTEAPKLTLLPPPTSRPPPHLPPREREPTAVLAAPVAPSVICGVARKPEERCG